MISTESTSNNRNWASLQGTLLEGGYQVEELLRSDDGAATFRIRVLGDFRHKATANFYAVEPRAAEEQVALWQRIRAIRHPNLSAPLAAGRVALTGTPLVYAVLDGPDETLSGVLEERNLTKSEADEILNSLKNAAAELHARGLVHGCISPSEVLAFGTATRLSTVCVRKAESEPAVSAEEPRYLAPESTTANLTPASDVWCIGATVLEALTRMPCAGADCREQAAPLEQPLRRIIEHCLNPDPEQRARLSDFEKLRRGELVPAAAAAAGAGATATPFPAAAIPPPSPAAPIRVGPPLSQSRPDPTAAAPRLSRPELNRIEKRRSLAAGKPAFYQFRTWIYGAAALLVAVLLIWAGRPKRQETVTGPAKPAASTPAAQSGTAWPTRTLSPDPAATASRRVASSGTAISNRSPHQGANSADPAVWRLVLYTFSREPDAQRRAQAINQRHPGLNAEVFSPSSRNRMYLVVAGGRMTRDQAAKLHAQALRMGMPGDSYIQNYKQ
jgi:serine/threonine protein kinase